MILFTEDAGDFTIIRTLADAFGFHANVFNIPLHGFSEYPKALSYREAYQLLIGGTTPHTVLLDRDYYPEDYLAKARDDLAIGDIATIYTPGKEVENIFLSPGVLCEVIPKEYYADFESFWEKVFTAKKLDAYSSYLTLHKQFLSAKLDTKTVTKRFTPLFEKAWADKKKRHCVIEGKPALHSLRSFFREATGTNLTMRHLTQACVVANDSDARNLAGQAFGVLPKKKQVLHY